MFYPRVPLPSQASFRFFTSGQLLKTCGARKDAGTAASVIQPRLHGTPFPKIYMIFMFTDAEDTFVSFFVIIINIIYVCAHEEMKI